jgi:hypothetical protein
MKRFGHFSGIDIMALVFFIFMSLAFMFNGCVESGCLRSPVEMCKTSCVPRSMKSFIIDEWGSSTCTCEEKTGEASH